MRSRPYKRRPGDFEIRILSDGRVVMIAPDEKLLEVAQIIEPGNTALPPKAEGDEHVRCKNTESRQKSRQGRR